MPKPGERVIDVRFDDDTLSVDLADGRTIAVPLTWYPRLVVATPAQRANWQPCAAGFGIHWPDLDEDLSTQGLLAGAPAPRQRVTEYLNHAREQLTAQRDALDQQVAALDTALAAIRRTPAAGRAIARARRRSSRKQLIARVLSSGAGSMSVKDVMKHVRRGG